MKMSGVEEGPVNEMGFEGTPVCNLFTRMIKGKLKGFQVFLMYL